MRKKRLSMNPHAVAHLALAVIASILLGALVGRVLVVVSKTPAFKERRTEFLAFVTGRPRLDFRKTQRLASEPYRSRHLNGN